MDKKAIEEKYIKNKNLVYYILKKYYPNYQFDEDMFQVGSIGLVSAIKTFDEAKGFSFSTYAIRCIMNEINMEFRKIKRKEKLNTISYDELIVNQFEDSEISFQDVILQYEDKNFDNLEFNDLLKNIYKTLNKKEIILLNGLLVKIPQTKLAKLLDISQPHCSREQKKVINKIKEYVISSYS